VKTGGTDNYSAFLPLHEGLIVTTDGVEVGVAGAELDTDDMLGVTTEASWLTTAAARVAEEADKAVIVTSGEESAVV